MRQVPEKVRGLVEPIVEGMGYELVGIEYFRQPRGDLLRIYIDRAPGITLDDCEAVSNQVSAAMDVEEPIQGHYNLEVSSPGLDRPLFEAAHFRRFAGHRVKVRLQAPLDGRRNFTGRLCGVEDDSVIVEVDDRKFELPLSGIEQARLVPEL